MYIECGSEYCAGHDNLMLWINIITVLAFLLVNGVLMYFVIQYRRRGKDDKTSPIAHSTTIEVVWTVIPSIVFVWLYIWGMIEFLEMRPGKFPDNTMIIAVEGKQWAWEYTYPAEFRQEPEKATQIKSYNDVYLMEGRPTKLVMKSKDVLHSFFIPAFRVKEDVTPNIFTYVYFEPSKFEGDRMVYDIYCTEYCGKDHSAMIGKAIVLKEDAFKNQLAVIEKEAGDISPEKGEALYAANCKACHSTDGSRIVGPSFQGLWGAERSMADGTAVVADENYIRNSILNPNAQIVEGYPAAMPAQGLSEPQIQSVIAYMKTLQ